jgi:hypothetical protein
MKKLVDWRMNIISWNTNKKAFPNGVSASVLLRVS